MKANIIFSIVAATVVGAVSAGAQITYEGGKGPGAGKHIVFVASDHEYRAEQTCPALARILAKHHGFKCTVLFGVDEDGFIEAGASDIKGLEALSSADSMVIFTRFLNLPDEQMKHIADYLDQGKPVLGLRTSSHAFNIPPGNTYSRFHFKYEGEEYLKGFGHQVLGNTWVGHHGRNNRQGTRIEIIPEQAGHPILKGVQDHAFCYAGGYVGEADESFTVLTNSQPLVSMDATAAADKNKPPMPSTWTRHYEGKNGQKGRVFHSTQGASQDILDENYRRMLINGVYWINGLENQISAESNVDFVGEYVPTPFKNGAYVMGVKPSDLAGFDGPVVPKGLGIKPVPPKKKKKARQKKPAAAK